MAIRKIVQTLVNAYQKLCNRRQIIQIRGNTTAVFFGCAIFVYFVCIYSDICLKILAHNNLIGRIIGKGGNTIKRIMQDTETKITVSSINDINSFNLERIITVKGTIDSMSAAEAQISAKLRQSYENDLQAMAPQTMMFPGLHPMAMMATAGETFSILLRTFPGSVYRLWFCFIIPKNRTIFLTLQFPKVFFFFREKFYFSFWPQALVTVPGDCTRVKRLILVCIRQGHRRAAATVRKQPTSTYRTTQWGPSSARRARTLGI